MTQTSPESTTDGIMQLSGSSDQTFEIEFPTLDYVHKFAAGCTVSTSITYTSTSSALKIEVDAIDGLSLTVNGADGDSTKPTLTLKKDSSTYAGTIGSSQTFTIKLT